MCASALRGRGGGSGVRTSAIDTAETRNDAASNRIAIGAVSAVTRNPAIPGPDTSATDSESASLAFACTRFSRSTSDGTYAWYDTSKRTVSRPAAAATT